MGGDILDPFRPFHERAKDRISERPDEVPHLPPAEVLPDEIGINPLNRPVLAWEAETVPERLVVPAPIFFSTTRLAFEVSAPMNQFSSLR